MNEKVKIGILGCADIARRRAIPAFQAIDNAEVVSIASRDYDKAREWGKDFNIDAEKSYESLLANREVDAVYLPLPIGLHKEWVLKAAKAKKHIICEKSVAGDLKSAREMVATCKSKDIVFYENFMCDFHPQHKRVIDILENGDIGKPFIFRGYFGFTLTDKTNIRYNPELDCGSLNDVGAYPVFMARKILDMEPVAVIGFLFDDAQIGVDTGGSAIMEFPNGQSALIGFSFTAAYQNNYSVWGSLGCINVGPAYSIPPDMKPRVSITKVENYKEIVANVDAPVADQFELAFYDFCSTVLKKTSKKKKIEKNYSQILSQAKVMEALRISAREKKSVKIAQL